MTSTSISFLYPNVNFISMAGVIIPCPAVQPVAPDETDVRLTMTTGRKRDKIPALPAILWGHMKKREACDRRGYRRPGGTAARARGRQYARVAWCLRVQAAKYRQGLLEVDCRRREMNPETLTIIGDGAIVRDAASIARRTRDPASVLVESLAPDSIATSALAFLREADQATTAVFAAIGVSALNYARFDLWARLRLLGYRCATLVDPSAAIDPSAKLADNVMIGAYAVIGADVELRSGTIVQSRACIQVGAKVDRFSWDRHGRPRWLGRTRRCASGVGPRRNRR